MGHPVNVFWELLKNLKDLVVSVKIGSSEAVPHGAFLEQLSNTKFKVEDGEGNQGVCELVNKHTEQLLDNEMSILGFVLNSSAFVYIASIVNNIMNDFTNKEYTWHLDNDSTTNVLILTGKL